MMKRILKMLKHALKTWPTEARPGDSVGFAKNADNTLIKQLIN